MNPNWSCQKAWVHLALFTGLILKSTGGCQNTVQWGDYYRQWGDYQNCKFQNQHGETVTSMEKQWSWACLTTSWGLDARQC